MKQENTKEKTLKQIWEELFLEKEKEKIELNLRKGNILEFYSEELLDSNGKIIDKQIEDEKIVGAQKTDEIANFSKECRKN